MDGESVPTAVSLPSGAPDPAVRPPTPAPPRRRRLGLWAGGVAALLLGAGGLVTPKLLCRSLNANESAAIAALKNISSAQSQLQAMGFVDENENGVGEYGFFAELAGVVTARGSHRKCSPPVLGQRFAKVVNGRVHAGGYVFQMFLRGPDGAWVGEAANGGAAGVPVDAEHAETEWMCYAWPEEQGCSGKRAFLVTSAGDTFACILQTRVYGGEAGPEPGVAGWTTRDGKPVIAANTTDAIGNMWAII